jgi:hypothetical protein
VTSCSSLSEISREGFASYKLIRAWVSPRWDNAWIDNYKSATAHMYSRVRRTSGGGGASRIV